MKRIQFNARLAVAIAILAMVAPICAFSADQASESPIELVRRTGLPAVPVATRPLDDINAVFGELRAGKIVGRVVLTPN